MAQPTARHLLVVSALALSVGTAAACGSSGSAGSAEATEETYVVVPDSAVTAGLAELGTMGAAVAAGIAAGRDSTSDVDDMFKKWESFEGTVRQNETDLYLAVEDNLANLRKAAKDKDAAAATKAVQGIADTAKSYLAKHP